jgi:hypothetical protein
VGAGPRGHFRNAERPEDSQSLRGARLDVRRLCLAACTDRTARLSLGSLLADQPVDAVRHAVDAVGQVEDRALPVDVQRRRSPGRWGSAAASSPCPVATTKANRKLGLGSRQMRPNGRRDRHRRACRAMRTGYRPARRRDARGHVERRVAAEVGRVAGAREQRDRALQVAGHVHVDASDLASWLMR